MLKNHFKIAFRQLKKQKFYSLVNIVGLAIGVACCLLIALFVRDELSYDRYHPNSENLYRVVLDINLNDWKGVGTVGPPILAKTLIEEIPEIENAARLNPYFSNAGSNIVRKENEKENQFEEGFAYVDQSFFELFHLPLIEGDKSTILTKPNSIVISERIAEKYFPNQNPIGNTLILNDTPESTMTVTGVMTNIPRQSHFQYDFLMSMTSLEDESNTSWIFNNYYTYVALADGTTPKQLQTKLRAFTFKNFGPQFKEQMNTDLQKIEKSGQHYQLGLQPISDIHLKSGTEYIPQLEANGDIRYVRLFGAIALFIFIIALVNFVNLTTARSANRAKEVGLRKVLGSVQKQLVAQFLMESILMSVFAFGVGIGIAHLCLPMFNELSGKELIIPFLEIGFVPIMTGCAVLSGLLAGLYPSFYLSAFQPVKVLKGKLSLGSKSGWLRSSLVVVQFAISIGLIVGTMVVYQQMNFIQNKRLGFDKDQVLLIQDTYTLGDKMPAFKEALKKLPEAKGVTRTSFLPLEGGRRNSITFYQKGKSEVQDQVIMQTWNVDEDYIETLGMELVKGRNFNMEMPTDKMGVILNETAAKEFGVYEDPEGQLIYSPFMNGDFNVIGIVKDFNYESLKGEIEPLGLILGGSSSVVSIKTTPTEMENLIAKAEGIWKEFVPGQPYRYDFLDDRFAKMYKTEDRVGKLFGVFSILAIFIACLGLLALATFMTEQRMKEIGIRKVLGASVPTIVFQLSKKFLLYVVIGLLIATPVAWIQMSEWLNNFEYRIDMQLWMVVLAGVLAVGIAFLTVGSKTLIAALTNPVESLRNE